ncbi:MAG TPA: cytochrome c peroxidase [Chitinophagaceae bacterium]
MKKVLLLGCLCLVAVSSCNPPGTLSKRDTTTPEDSIYKVARGYFKVLPVVAVSEENPLTQAKVHLGKILYYDTRLSKNGNSSCNSCHNLATFGVDNEVTSDGDDGSKGTRNSPTVFNAALHNMQFWDGRAKDVEEQAGMPILNSVEMGIPHEGFLIERLTGIKLYQELFKDAFPGEEQPLTYANLQKAIGAFERTLLTPSRFDQYMQGDRKALNSVEKAGLLAFVEAGCTTCHNGVGIGGGTMQRFGLVTDYRSLTRSRLNDEGRKAVTQYAADKDVFKVPGLRNIKGTFPYFHDGSVAGLDSAVIIMGKAELNKELSKQEVRQIVAFLNSLTGEIDPEAKKIPAELAKH